MDIEVWRLSLRSLRSEFGEYLIAEPVPEDNKIQFLSFPENELLIYWRICIPSIYVHVGR